MVGAGAKWVGLNRKCSGKMLWNAGLRCLVNEAAKSAMFLNQRLFSPAGLGLLFCALESWLGAEHLNGWSQVVG